jgi:hypothetical protein
MNIKIYKQNILLLIIAGFLSTFICCNSKDKNANSLEDNKATLYTGDFGTCCNDLKDAMDTTKVTNSFFRVDENKILYQTVGYIETNGSDYNGKGYFEQAVIYCPFCGKKLQDKNEIKKKAN